MANKPFEYTIINPLERPKSADINQMQGQAHADVRLLARQLFTNSTTGAEGFVNRSFKVTSLSGVFGFGILQGVGFQNGTANTSIGSISGLNDEYPYKPLTISDREVTFPSGYECASGYYRYDLVQVRALAVSEQLGNAQPTDILTPSAQTFSPTEKFKTLTFDLTDVDIQYMDTGDTPTAPIVVKKGVAVSSGNATEPSVDSGYLALAYLPIGDTATPLNALLVDLGDARTLLSLNMGAAFGVLPVENGGTGRSSLTANALLVGDGTSSVDSLEPGTLGQVVRSNGTAWEAADLWSLHVKNAIAATDFEYTVPRVESGTWVEIAALGLTNASINPGVVRLAVHPAANGLPAKFLFDSGPISTDDLEYFLKLEISGTTLGGTPISYTYMFYNNSATGFVDWAPNVNTQLVMSAGTYSFKLYAQYTATDSPIVKVKLNNTALTVTQG